MAFSAFPLSLFSIYFFVLDDDDELRYGYDALHTNIILQKGKRPLLPLVDDTNHFHIYVVRVPGGIHGERW